MKKYIVALTIVLILVVTASTSVFAGVTGTGYVTSYQGSQLCTQSYCDVGGIEYVTVPNGILYQGRTRIFSSTGVLLSTGPATTIFSLSSIRISSGYVANRSSFKADFQQRVTTLGIPTTNWTKVASW